MGDEPICCHLEADAYKDRAAWNYRAYAARVAAFGA